MKEYLPYLAIAFMIGDEIRKQFLIWRWRPAIWKTRARNKTQRKRLRVGRLILFGVLCFGVTQIGRHQPDYHAGLVGLIMGGFVGLSLWTISSNWGGFQIFRRGIVFDRQRLEWNAIQRYSCIQGTAPTLRLVLSPEMGTKIVELSVSSADQELLVSHLKLFLPGKEDVLAPTETSPIPARSWTLVMNVLEALVIAFIAFSILRLAGN